MVEKNCIVIYDVTFILDQVCEYSKGHEVCTLNVCDVTKDNTILFNHSKNSKDCA